MGLLVIKGVPADLEMVQKSAYAEQDMSKFKRARSVLPVNVTPPASEIATCRRKRRAKRNRPPASSLAQRPLSALCDRRPCAVLQTSLRVSHA